MKVYISGKITGLPYEEAVRKFKRAEEQVRSFGYEPVNPICNGIDIEAQWKEHMKVDIGTLLDCEAIYLLQDWSESRGARIERNIAEEMGHFIMMQPEYVAM